MEIMNWKPFHKVWVRELESPQGLKPDVYDARIGTAEAVPFQIAFLRPVLGRSPKMAVPIRTQVEPSSMATSKSCDIPTDSTSRRTDGRPRALRRSRSSRSLRK